MLDPSSPLKNFLDLTKRKIKENSQLARVLENTGWLFLDRIVRMGVGVVTTVWLARYLGPVQFGIINYASALVVVMTTVSALGLNSIVVRELVNEPEHEQAILSASLTLQIAAGFIGWAILSIYAIQFESPEIRSALIVLGLSAIVRSTDTIKYWFEAKILSKYIVWIENFSFFVSSAIKLWLIFEKANVISFIWVMLAELSVSALLFIFVFSKKASISLRWKVGVNQIKELLVQSWPLILSGVAAIVYMRIDQVMLARISSMEEVGIYSAAVRISEIWYFIPLTIVSSIFPLIVRSRKEGADKFREQTSMLLEAMTLISILLAVLVTAIAGGLIKVLYGAEFFKASSVLTIHVWACIFVFSGVVGGRWMIIENLQKHSFYRAAAGGVVSVALNLILIPSYGAIGSAWALVISQATASIFFNCFSKKTRPLFWMQIRALVMPRLFRRAAMIFK